MDGSYDSPPVSRETTQGLSYKECRCTALCMPPEPRLKTNQIHNLGNNKFKQQYTNAGEERGERRFYRSINCSIRQFRLLVAVVLY